MNRASSFEWPRLLAGSLGFLLLFLLWVRWADAIGAFSATRGWDFPAFYIAAHVNLTDLYSREAFITFGHERLAPVGMLHWPSYVRPAVFALALRPLALFSFWRAYWLWVGVGIGAYFATAYVLMRWLNLSPYVLAPFGAFMPAVFGIITGQDITVYALVMTLALILLLEEHDVAAGILLGICAYKFNLILLVPVALIAHRRWKAVATLVAAVAIEAATSALMVSPRAYVGLLRHLSEPGTEGVKIAGLRGVLVAVHHPQWFAPLATVALVACICVIYRLPLREAFCVAITGALLFGYKTAWYDCTLLVLPLAILIATGGRALRVVVSALLVVAPLWLIASDIPLNVVVETGILLVFAARPNAVWSADRLSVAV